MFIDKLSRLGQQIYDNILRNIPTGNIYHHYRVHQYTCTKPVQNFQRYRSFYQIIGISYFLPNSFPL